MDKNNVVTRFIALCFGVAITFIGSFGVPWWITLFGYMIVATDAEIRVWYANQRKPPNFKKWW